MVVENDFDNTVCCALIFRKWCHLQCFNKSILFVKGKFTEHVYLPMLQHFPLCLTLSIRFCLLTMTPLMLHFMFLSVLPVDFCFVLFFVAFVPNFRGCSVYPKWPTFNSHAWSEFLFYYFHLLLDHEYNNIQAAVISVFYIDSTSGSTVHMLHHHSKSHAVSATPDKCFTRHFRTQSPNWMANMHASQSLPSSLSGHTADLLPGITDVQQRENGPVPQSYRL